MIIFNGDLKTGNLSQFSAWGKEIPYSSSCVVVNTPAIDGGHSIRFILNRSDPKVSGSMRAEIANSKDENKDPVGSERWYKINTYIPNDWIKDTEREIVVQWHATPDRWRDDKYEDWRSPPLSIQINGNDWEIETRWDSRPVTPDNDCEGYETIWKGPIQRGEWTQWVIHVKWNYNSSGLLQVWKNNIRVVNKNGPVCYNDRKGIYLKIGIYKWRWLSSGGDSIVDKRIIYHSGVQIGDSNSNYTEILPHYIPPSNKKHNIKISSVPMGARIYVT